MKHIAIDEEGFFLNNNIRLDDDQFAIEIFENLKLNEAGVPVSSFKGEPVSVDAFDQPFVVKQLHAPTKETLWTGQVSHGYQFKFDLQTLALDEWDRFHGYDSSGRPFVLSRSAQADFFNLLDEFDDDSITYAGTKYEIPLWLESSSNVSTGQFWSEIYDSTTQPFWDLDAPVKALVDTLPQIKLTKQRVLVLGCGKGHDAAYLAEQGNIVTAVDFSETALTQAKERYPNLKNIEWVQADFFNLPEDFKDNFDLIFEHTCYCAIDPEKRNDLVKVWRQCLAEGGHLLGVFFVHTKNRKPPFGATEWELKKRLTNKFDFRYWTRWQASEGWREGLELVIYAQKKG